MSENTKEKLLAIARTRVQAHGYDGLNFRDLAAMLGIRAPSLYHHFPSKAALGAAVAWRYCDDVQAALDAVSQSHPSPRACLLAYPGIFRKALEGDTRICLASFLSAQNDDVPEEIREAIQAFIDINVTWLAGHLSTLASQDIAMRRADAIYAAVAGAQLTARGSGGLGRYDDLIATFRESGLLGA